ncbi:hypothetical protein [Acanthopleuribacter pedis]|uniref:DUF4159 domain-containing protein n=1 Tax=Acanthopleuribacter pedis TaxID=442870 RepID=A0A8J7U5I6_9BACT|nr:hypothetical protein [Acanthopleuribacter pedis]MBO1320488.1 hypothetical protein [Acanthopleuribacter pedis]
MMERVFKKGLIAVSAFLISLAGLQAASKFTYLEDVSVSLDFPEDAESPHGYHPVAVHLQNETNQEIRLTVLYMGGYADHWRDSPLLARHDLVLAPRESRKLKHRLPAWLEMPHQVRFLVNGELRDESISISKSRSFSRRESYLPQWISVLTLTTKDPSAESLLDETVQQLGSWEQIGEELQNLIGYTKETTYLHRATLDASLFSESWLDYTAWDMVLLTVAQWQQLGPGQKRALDHYMRVGGILIVLQEQATTSWPADFPTALDEAPDEIHRGHHDFGLAAAVPAGFHQIPEARSTWQPIIRFAVNRAAFWRCAQFEPFKRNEHFPVIGELDIPRRAFIGLLLLFVICMGPLNFWFVMRHDRRVWLYATVPLLSLCATLVLVVAAFASEGITPGKRGRALVAIDHERQQAATWATGAVYLPIANRNGLFFSGRNEIYFPNDDWFINKGINLANGLWLQHGFLRTRIPFHYQERGRYPLRERLAVQFDAAGVPTVTNGFAADVAPVHVTNTAGALYRIDRIAAGETQTLSLSREAPATPPQRQPLAAAESFEWKLTETHMLGLFQDEHRQIQLGSRQYLAVLEGAAYQEEPLEGNLKRDERTVLFGRLEAP